MTMFWIMYVGMVVVLNIGMWAINEIAKHECTGCPYEDNFFKEVFSYEVPTVRRVLGHLATSLIWPVWMLLGTVYAVIRAVKK